MHKRSLARPFALVLAGCAHWGTPNIASEPPLPPVTSTYLAPTRPPLPSDAPIALTSEPPPEGSTVIAISSAPCSTSDLDDCSRALIEAARQTGSNSLFGVHTEYVPRLGTRLIGSSSFDPRAGRASPPSSDARTVELSWQPRSGGPTLDVFLERRESDLRLRGPPEAREIPIWQPVCKLPCSATLDGARSYRLTAPALSDESPLPLPPPASDRVEISTREGQKDYSRIWWGLGITLVAGGVGGGSLGCFFANPGKPAGAAELTVGLLVLPYIVVGIGELLLGPVTHEVLTAD